MGIRPFLHYISILICVVISPGGDGAVEVANDHIGSVIVQGIWVIKLELSSWWFSVMVILPMLTVGISMSLFSVIDVEVMTRSGFT